MRPGDAQEPGSPVVIDLSQVRVIIVDFLKLPIYRAGTLCENTGPSFQEGRFVPAARQVVKQEIGI